MRLDYALISTFLFLSVVLADLPRCPGVPLQSPWKHGIIYPGGKTFPLHPGETNWAGGMWCTDDEKQSVDFVAGKFTIPKLGFGYRKGDGFIIRVGLGGYIADESAVGFHVSAGVQVIVGNTGYGSTSPQYRAFGHCGSQIVYADDDGSFYVYPGNVLRVLVVSFGAGSFTTVTITRLNPSNKKISSWSKTISCRQISACTVCTPPSQLYDALWILEKYWGTVLPLFGQVAFKNVQIRIRTMNSEGEEHRQRPQLENMYKLAIVEGGKQMTWTVVKETDKDGVLVEIADVV